MEKYKEERPWGEFEQYCKNQQCTVKIITVKPQEELSLQYHNHRDEFWKVIKGKAQITLGDKIIEAKEGDEFYIPKKTKHRITTQESQVKILEISFGEFDANDIVRLEDKYKRK
ncbi:phosphomannose isomerase type II C-terminal cupin domain [Candidatus Woesearchaeota archaeon]|nr:phosphomannose isomerase type II C-terminal cupin domain [Candidatus Woesearchaeota archaeon]